MIDSIADIDSKGSTTMKWNKAVIQSKALNTLVQYKGAAKYQP